MKTSIFWLFAMTALVGSGALYAAEPVSTVQWAATALGASGGAADVKLADEGPLLVLKRQDHGELGLSRSVMGNRIKIGSATFNHGLGTHSTSEIDVKLPAGGSGVNGAKRFSAMVGIDNNDSTGGHLGTVEFSVEIGGKEVWKSGIKRGGEEASPVDIEIPADATELVLKVSDGGDGPAFDHSDWADAKLTMADGHALLLDTLPPPSFWPAAKVIPFSFVYDGKSSGEFLSKWKHEAKSEETAAGAKSVATWRDEATGLRVTATATAYKDFPAVEWLLNFENTGKADSPILENVQALDVLLPAATSRHIVLDQIKGDDASPDSFTPMERDLKSGDVVPLAPNGGRPSNGTFPFFDIENDSEHVFVAIGWTGQWAAGLARDAAGVHIKAGMELTHLKLHPGEAIRSPRILLLNSRGDRMDAHNQFRRLLLAHYVPRVNGELPKFAVSAQTFNMVFGAGIRPEWATEAGQIAAAKINKAIGCDTLWMDAGWFDGNFPNGVGNWTVKKKEFPRGLGPVGEFCKQIGLDFLVWYEPERVAPGTRITTTDEQSVLTAGQPKANGGLLNLSDDATAKKMTDMILRQMDEGAITHYRNDFNIDPLPFWRANDAPDRQGMTEIRYVENFYKMWDAIRAKRPETIPDDCASGGRRIDLEMVMRSIVQTRSDAAVAPGRSNWHQSETYGLSLYLPLHATIGWETDTYAMRSVGLAGVCFEWDILDPKFPAAVAKAGIDEIRANQKYWSGDFYPLTPFAFGTQAWMAWQLDRPDLGEGLIMAFRREDCPYTGLELALRAIKADASYHVELIDQERHVENKTMSGKELAAMELQLPKRGSVIVRYALVQK